MPDAEDYDDACSATGILGAQYINYMSALIACRACAMRQPACAL